MPTTHFLQSVPSFVAAAEMRHREMLAEAADARRCAQARVRPASTPRSVVTALRGAVGTALVRLGEGLQGASRTEPADRAVAAVGGQ